MSQPDRRPRDQNRGSFGRGRGGARSRGRGRGRAGTQSPRNVDPQPENGGADPQNGDIGRGHVQDGARRSHSNKAERGRGRGAGKHHHHLNVSLLFNIILITVIQYVYCCTKFVVCLST